MTAAKSPPTHVEITTDPSRFDIDVIHGFLSRTYWSPDIPRRTVERAIAGSMGFAAFAGGRQVGFARVITDKATFAYVSDVFVLDEYQGRGVASRIMEAIRSHPDLQRLRRWVLLTKDAHRLYEKFGFRAPADPDRYMEILDRTVYPE
jgi:GNAT superfamily N-acetyltransferase